MVLTAWLEDAFILESSATTTIGRCLSVNTIGTRKSKNSEGAFSVLRFFEEMLLNTICKSRERGILT